MTTPLTLAPQIDTSVTTVGDKLTQLGKGAQSASDKAHAKATDFEAVFLSSMFQHMFTDIGNEGPLGNGTGVGVWRTFLTNEYGKSLAKSGGIGLAKQVYKSLMAHQEASAK